MNLAEQVKQAGVVGAGGGGFPTHVKLSARADTVIANGAECEPLLHKDAAVMEHQARAMIRGIELARAEMRAAGRTWTGKTEVKPHPMRDGRRVPIHTLARKMHVDQYETPAPLRPEPLQSSRVSLPLQQQFDR